MSWVSIDRTFDGTVDPPRYRPKLTVRFPEGAPRGLPLPVSARLARGPGEEPVFDLQAGGVPVTSAGAGELVIALPSLTPIAAPLTFETTVASRVVRSPLPSRPIAEQAVFRAEHALAKVPADAPFLTAGSLDSVRYLTRRLANLLSRGDGDLEAQTDEARELDRLAAALEHDTDPYEGRTGRCAAPCARRSTATTPSSGSTSRVVQGERDAKVSARRRPARDETGTPMGILRWMFGGDDPKHDQSWEDRHVGTLPPSDAFIITPFGHGNSLYRELGEVDIMNAVAWAMRRFPIDPSRVTITGHRWAASAPPRYLFIGRMSSPPPRRSAATTASSSAATCPAARSVPGRSCSPRSARMRSGGER